jgi:hypothetical protein
MNKLPIIAILILNVINSSCDSKLKNYTTTTFYTQDSLYKVTFDKPIELDTFYTWKDEDDNACSDEHKYRFSKKNFPPQCETGFFWTSFVDSTYRITLKHVEGFDCKSEMDNEKLIESQNHLELIYRKFKSDNPKVSIDTIFQKQIIIKGQSFTLYSYRLKEDYYITHNFYNGYWTDYLKALTVIDGNLLVLTADCRTKNNSGFIQRMEKSFETISIERVKNE